MKHHVIIEEHGCIKSHLYDYLGDHVLRMDEILCTFATLHPNI
jgi:hypothetical protein